MTTYSKEPIRWVVAAAAVIMQAGLGSFYAWSVFREPLSNLYGANVTRVNVTFFIATLMVGIAAFGGGLLVRRIGPQVVGVVGGVLYGLGVFLASFAEGNLPVLYLTYGLIAGTGVGLGYIAPVVALPRWFPDRPGLAYGIAVCGFGAGPAIGVPTANYLISSTGGPLQAFGMLGLAYVVLVGGAALFMINPPEDHRLDERRPPEWESDKATEQRSWDFRGALRTWQWYAMWIMLFVNTTAGLAIISDAKAMAAEVGGASAIFASAFVVIVALADVAGRIFWPTLSDRIGPSHVFLTMFLLQAAAFLLLPLLGAGRFVLFAIFASIVLTCYGGGYGTMPALVDAYYGSEDVGSIYGSIITASGVAGFGAPLLLALFVDTAGSYSPALYVTAGIMLVGAGIARFIRPPGFPRCTEVGAAPDSRRVR
jgi:OFA family oxalate/formate antiporter-like MFS transporter